MRKSFLILALAALAPFRSQALDDDDAYLRDEHDRAYRVEPSGPWSLSFGGSASIAGDSMASRDVKPFTNARKYGLNRGWLDAVPSRSLALGRQIGDGPINLELNIETSDVTYEIQSFFGPTLANTVTSTYLSSVTLAPSYLWRCYYLNWGLGLRLGAAALASRVETASPSDLLGRKDQYSSVFTCEPYVRIEWPLVRHFKIGLDLGYSYRNFWQVFNMNQSGVYEGGSLTEKNPDGTDTAVDLSGWKNRGYISFVF